MKDRKIIKQAIPGKALVCVACPFRYSYYEGRKRVSNCLLESWDKVRGSGANLIPRVYKGVDPPEGCVYYQRSEE